MGMVITDLDGTLLNSNGKYSERILKSLNDLKKENVLRVIATGRSLFSFNQVIPKDFPIDYLIFSSGAGIYDWKNQKLIKHFSLELDEIKRTYKTLESLSLSSFLHAPVPNNEFFILDNRFATCEDFEARLKKYNNYQKPWSAKDDFLKSWGHRAAQFICVSNADDPSDLIDHLQKELKELKIIRATSPLDGKSAWIEIFPKSVSKSQASQWLRDHLGIAASTKTYAIGNDYNDVDMLSWADEGFMVANAPEILKLNYKKMPSNDDEGFCDFVQVVLG